MKILYAAAHILVGYDLIDYIGNYLESYLTMRSTGITHPYVRWMAEHPKPDRTSLLDSGAFSAWSKNEKIDIDSYIEFCQQTRSSFEAFANLDVIPGRWGQIPSSEEVEQSATEGWMNFRYMVERGLPREKVVHVFHQGEDFKWLEKLVEYHEKEGSEIGYIGISPANDRTTEQKIYWLERCMPYITKPDGSARIKFHGFGVTAYEIMRRYPWYSVDSTTWMRMAAYGRIHVPDKFKDFSKVDVIGVTDQSALASNILFNKSTPTVHLGVMPKEYRKQLDEYLATFGVTAEQSRTDYKARLKIALHYFKGVEEQINADGNNWKKLQETFI